MAYMAGTDRDMGDSMQTGLAMDTCVSCRQSGGAALDRAGRRGGVWTGDSDVAVLPFIPTGTCELRCAYHLVASLAVPCS